MKRDAVFFIGGLIIMGCAGFAVGAAEPVSCVTSVRGEAFVLQYDPDDQLIGENYGWRERFFGPGGDIDFRPQRAGASSRPFPFHTETAPGHPETSQAQPATSSLRQSFTYR